MAALLVSFAYAAVRLRLRRPFLLADWPMAAAALFLLFYYTKFLARMDLPHAYQPFVVAIPLIIYIIYRAVSALERWVRSGPFKKRTSWMPARPVGLAVLIFFLVSFWGPVHTVVDAAPAAYRPVAPAPPAVARVGYSSQVDTAAVHDLQQIVNAYLGPHDRLLDITDEPALFYYFLGRGPSSRWYAPNGIVDTAELQRNLLDEVRRAPPKLIIFDDTDTSMYGLPTMDGVPVSVRLYLISRWILEHYRPLLESHGRTIYALPSVPPVSSLHLHLNQQPTTVGVPFLGQECNWGYAPAFLGQPAVPSSSAPAVPVHTTVVHGPQIILSGWAGDLHAEQAGARGACDLQREDRRPVNAGHRPCRRSGGGIPGRVPAQRIPTVNSHVDARIQRAESVRSRPRRFRRTDTDPERTPRRRRGEDRRPYGRPAANRRHGLGRRGDVVGDHASG